MSGQLLTLIKEGPAWLCGQGIVKAVDGIAKVLATQDHLITRQQVRELGMTRSALRWRLERDVWRQVLPGIYAAVTGALSWRQRALAAMLYGGPSAQLTGAAALKVHGLRYLPPDHYLRVLVPERWQRRSVGFVRLHRTRWLDQRARFYDPLLLVSPARAVADAARWCDNQRAVRAMVAEVVQRRLTSVERLRAELERAHRNGSALLRAAIGEVADGARSVVEAELRQLLGTSRVLPDIRWNPRLVAAGDGRTLPTPDGWIEEVGLALEVDSREYHSSPEDWARTVERHNLLARYGALVLHFLPSRIRHDPVDVLGTVEQAYLERRRTGASAAIRVATITVP